LFTTVFVAAFAVSLHAQTQDLTIVKTESGTVRGVEKAGVISWKGIPYAAPPVGKLRWRVPQPPVAWPGIREANWFAPACIQADPAWKSEDCLFLNVWRSANATQPLPVMVWIHGEALVQGSSTPYPPDALALQGVVVVSMNYRMGRLGFFAHPALVAESPDDVRGNYGFMDQLAVLKWVQRNIGAFGGDPKQVTIFGESAGGGSVLVHLVSPMSRGLFARAIIESAGTPGGRARVIPSTDLATAEKIAAEWTRSAGITTEGPAALEQLRQLSPDKLVEGTSEHETMAALEAGKTPPGMAMSIIDGHFLTESVEAAVKAGHQAQVPVMIGANDRDLALGVAESKDQLFAVFGPDADAARRTYDPRGDQALDELKQQVFADKTMAEPARNLANLMARSGQAVYLYRFAYVEEAARGKLMGAPHGYEVPFAFDAPALVGEKVTPTDKVMGDVTSGYWVQFGKTGDPNGEGRPAWPRYDPAADRLIHFTNAGIIVGTDPLKPRLDLWERVWKRVE
jgi:para-nitrobenzyl esterase